MPDATPYSRPRDESLAAFKEWVLQIVKRLGGKDDLTEMEWIAAWQDFWKNRKAETDD
ncbi:MAG: hypothetical protein HY782_05050 [Chloroflexi bacterium]|nr:hypothetical protein [Chloroflexota bacterium]